jgi:hypothetical protein
MSAPDEWCAAGEKARRNLDLLSDLGDRTGLLRTAHSIGWAPKSQWHLSGPALAPSGRMFDDGRTIALFSNRLKT